MTTPRAIDTTTALGLSGARTHGPTRDAHTDLNNRYSSDQEDVDRVLREVIDNLLEGCQVIDREYRYVYVNDALVRQSQQSRDELIGQKMMARYPGIENTEMFVQLERCMDKREHRQFENEFTFPDGSKAWFELRFVPVPAGACILSLDITSEKRSQSQLARAEAELRHAQKMEAVGRLAGGIAHDFNNVLSAILTYVDLILEELPVSIPLRNDIEEIRSSARRGAKLTKQLLAFSRQQALSLNCMDLNEAVRSIGPMLRALLGADVELSVVEAPSACTVKADLGQIEQVLMNLAVNARDAMRQGGKLTIELANIELDAEYTEGCADVTPGQYVLLAVTDSGQGMSAETRARVFEPFFTTKDKGQGTGLGLSTVYGIVKQSGGHVWVYSEVGHGTVFKIYLPRADPDPAGASAAPLATRSLPDSDLPGATVLVVEDDEQVRAATCRALRRDGHTVLDAADSEHALLISSGDVHIDILLTDLVLPRVSGPEIARRLLERYPDLSVLYTSGYTDDTVVRHGIIPSSIAYLEKPLTPRKLRQKVREVLAKRADPSIRAKQD